MTKNKPLSESTIDEKLSEPNLGVEKEIFGILIIDKPEGMSSSFVDRICKKILGVKKIGHIGTLDPFATGVLPIAINAGTKTIPYIKTEKKTYEFEIKFGQKTNTADKTGEIVETSEVIPTAAEINNVLHKFIGEIYQKPHAFSAIKIDGKRAYEIARKGECPDIKERKITIFDLKLLQQTCGNIYKFVATVSPGTYIRTLTEDIAKAANSLGHTISLRRTLDGNFSINNAISIDNLRENVDNMRSVMLSLENVLDDIPVISVSNTDAENLVKGRPVSVASCFLDESIYSAVSENGFLGIVKFLDGFIFPKRIIRF